MNQISHAESQALLTCFFKECESRFRFLEEQYGYLYLSGLVAPNSGLKAIKPFEASDVLADMPFYAVTRYERDNQMIEVSYGDQDYALEIFVYPDQIRRLSLQDVIAAARGQPAQFQAHSYLYDCDILSQHLKQFAKIMHDQPKIFAPSEGLIKRAEKIRQSHTEQHIRSNFNALLNHASIRAAEAFSAKNYARVVEILDGYVAYLGASDLKKLHISQSKIS